MAHFMIVSCVSSQDNLVQGSKINKCQLGSINKGKEFGDKQ